ARPLSIARRRPKSPRPAEARSEASRVPFVDQTAERRRALAPRAPDSDAFGVPSLLFVLPLPVRLLHVSLRSAARTTLGRDRRAAAGKPERAADRDPVARPVLVFRCVAQGAQRRDASSPRRRG